jgi:dCMP deaminase
MIQSLWKGQHSMLGNRPSFDEILMTTARVWAGRSTCSRLSVGAVLAKDGRSVSSGFNGAPAGLRHCEHATDATCTTATHAEANVIGYAAREGHATKGATMYITHSPCYSCTGLILAAGIVRVVYGEVYKSTQGIDTLRKAGLTVEEMNDY